MHRGGIIQRKTKETAATAAAATAEATEDVVVAIAIVAIIVVVEVVVVLRFETIHPPAQVVMATLHLVHTCETHQQ